MATGLEVDGRDADRAARRRALVVAASRILVESTDDARETLDRIARVAVPSYADGCFVDLVDEGGNTFERVTVAFEGEGAATAFGMRDVRYPIRPEAPFAVARTMLDRKPQRVVGIDDAMNQRLATDATHLERLRALGLRSFLVAPLIARGAVVGCFTLVSKHRDFEPEDEWLVEQLAHTAASAVTHARLLDGERRARDRVDRMQEVIAALSRASTLEEVAEVACRIGGEAMHARSGALWLTNAEGELALVGWWGMPAEYIAPFRLMARDAPTPASAVLRAEAPIWIETEGDYRRAAPDLFEYAQRAGRLASWGALPLVLRGEVNGVFCFSHPLGHRYDADDRAFLAALAQHCAQALDRARLLDAERRTNARLRLLADSGEALAGSLDLDETLGTIARLVVPGFGDVCAIDLVDRDAIRRVAFEVQGAIARPLRDLDRRLGDGSALARVIETRASTLVPHVADGDARDLLDDVDVASLLVVPMTAGAESVGALSFARSAARRPYDRDDLEVAEQLGRSAGLAISNVRLFRREQEGRERIVRLQMVTSSLAGAATEADVANVAVAAGAEALGGDPVGVFYAVDGESLRLVADRGLSDSDRARYRALPRDCDLPAALCARERAAIWIESRAQLATELPALVAATIYPSRSGGAVACTPLAVGDRIVAVLAFVFDLDRRFTFEERAFVVTIGDHCAQAFERARLLDAERRAADRFALLARASEALNASLDYESTLRAVARSALPTLADYCFLDVVEEEGVRRVADANEGADRFEALSQTRWSIATRPDLCALTGGRSAFHPAIDDAWIDAATSDPRVREEVRRRGLCSMITVPLFTQTTRASKAPNAPAPSLLGALTLCHGTSGRRHTPDDLALAEELARRATVAIEQARLYAASQDSALRAEQANRIKDEFLATVSHELRTPLTAITGWSALLTKKVGDPAAMSRGLEVIRRNAAAQAKLVEDILDVSRIVTGKLKIDPRPVDLAAITRDALDVVRPSADAKRLTIVFDARGACTLIGDAERLQQCVWNLLSNAVKFTEAEGTVAVELEAKEGFVTICVTDSGVGIEPDLLPHVFERFRQGDSSTTRRFGGLGLGLAIVRHIVELHGGRVSVDSAGVGEGASFKIVLPVRPATANEVGRSVRPNPSGGELEGVAVLVVDDEADARELLRAVLAEAGAEVDEASSAADAIAAIARTPYDVVLSDIGMPGEDGFAFARKLRSTGVSQPLVALTAYARAEDRERAIGAGFDAFVSKPLDVPALFAAIADARARTVG